MTEKRLIHVEIPIGEGFEDWANRHTYILKGMELAAYQHVGKPWMVKSSRCRQCGTCCTTFRKDLKVDWIRDGKCIDIADPGEVRPCTNGLRMPFHCLISAGPRPKITGCTERYDPVL
jgi:hypothetical protein